MDFGPKSQKFQFLAILFLVIFCIIISILFQSIGYEQVYTHIFYVPIIISCIWWQRRGIALASFLGVVVVLLGFIFRPDALQLNNFLRAVVFVVIAFLVSEISISENRKSILLNQEIEKTKNSSVELSKKNEELEKFHKEILSKNEELEKINKMAMDREIKMIELKKRIAELEKDSN